MTNSPSPRTPATTRTPDPTAVLTGMYAAEAEYLAAGGPGEASFDLLAPYFSPDVVLRQADSLPYGGTWRGHAGMERFFLAMSRTWAAFDMREQEFLATGAITVVRTQVHAVARTTGRELAFPILQTITIAQGRITEVHPFYWDTGAVAAACAPPPA
ncbi:nuclear transport factor 2 family protein [Streptomyces flavofungini]|uniref:Nuclear transport factor 2 family protein n=1 Tax=Streptomyces flavofungini TaxID=68200 RepID=A0ABS0X1A9_9ACTN|nr:nuclear transport factor 2 family protein [Streptomyces flavofungini]MBJ3806964.1 nuclear transport factor 2 family protein [Streptomyces flavofungini]GHC59383.1 ketosteroid isomerase [Streptomyces flavofungini]